MDKIANALGARPLDLIPSEERPIVETSVEIVPNEVDASLEQASEDFQLVRQNLLDILDTAKDAFRNVADMATTSTDTRAIEAFSKVMDSMVKANKELMSVHKDMFGLQPPVREEKTQTADVINNVIFNGNAADLFKLLKEKGALPPN